MELTRRQILKRADTVPVGHDSTVFVGFNPDRLHLFAAGHGTALQAPRSA
jgi:hypothetical protein